MAQGGAEADPPCEGVREEVESVGGALRLSQVEPALRLSQVGWITNLVDLVCCTGCIMAAQSKPAADGEMTPASIMKILGPAVFLQVTAGAMLLQSRPQLTQQIM